MVCTKSDLLVDSPGSSMLLEKPRLYLVTKECGNLLILTKNAKVIGIKRIKKKNYVIRKGV